MAGGRAKFGSIGSTGTILLVAGILALVNFIAVRRFARLDVTQNHEYTVTPATRKILAGLDDVVNVTVYFSKDLPPYLSNIDRQVKDLLDEYRAYSKNRLHITFEDPGNDPQKERALQMLGIPKLQLNILEKEKAQVTNVYLGIAVTYGDKNEVIPVIQSTGTLEYDLTSAILKVTQAPPKIGMLTGHGEATLEKGGMSGVARELQRQYEVTPVDLKGGQPVPADLRTLVIPKPTQAIGDRDRYEIDQFVMRGGRLIVLCDGTELVPQQLMAHPFNSGLADLLGHWGARINNDLLLDASHVSTAFSSGYVSFMMPYPWFPRILPENLDKKSPVTATLQTLVLPWTSSIEVTAGADTGGGGDGAIHAEILATTSKQSFRQQGGMSVNPQQKIEPPAAGDMKKYPVAVALSGSFPSLFAGRPAPPPADSAEALTAPHPATVDRSPSTQVIVVSDGDFPLDQFAQQYPENRTFFMNLVDWCTLGDQLISIRSRSGLTRPLKPMADGTRSAVKLLNLLGLPLLVAGYGLFRWMSRRTTRKVDAYRS